MYYKFDNGRTDASPNSVTNVGKHELSASTSQVVDFTCFRFGRRRWSSRTPCFFYWEGATIDGYALGFSRPSSSSTTQEERGQLRRGRLLERGRRGRRRRLLRLHRHRRRPFPGTHHRASLNRRRGIRSWCPVHDPGCDKSRRGMGLVRCKCTDKNQV